MSAIECSVCFEDYAEDRRPLFLPCGHTFCEVCLGDMAKDQQVQCPKCQQTSNVPPAGHAINYDLLSSAVESRRGPAPPSASPPAASEAKSGMNEAKEGKPEIKCAECQEKVATLFCQGSCGDLCDDCSAVVHRLRINRDHVLGNISDRPKPKRMCPEHKDQEALLYCMQCQRLACVRCGFGSHRNHGAVDVAEAAAEKKALVRSRFESVQLRIAKLNTRPAKIGEEQKLSELERLSIAAAIDARADQLREAVTARQRQLQQDLGQLTAAKTKNLDLMQARDSSSLAALVQLAQDLKGLQEQDDLAVLDASGGLLSADRQGEQVDESFAAPSRLVSELDVSMLMEGIGQWGSVCDLRPVQDVVFDQGVVRWGGVAGALQYEVQISGPIDGSKEAKADEGQFKWVYQGSGTSWTPDLGLAGDGEYRVRVRAQLRAGWGLFSQPVLFQYKVVEWSADRMTGGIELISDQHGLKRVARHNDSASGLQSVLSSRPLAPPSPSPFASSPSSSSPSSPSSPSSLPLSGVASFKVRLDCLQRCSAWIGVSRALPPTLPEGEGGRVVGDEGCGVGWACTGSVYNHGQHARELDSYRDGDVIGVEVDFGAHTVSFFKNGVRQGDPIVLSERDRNQPLYATVTMSCQDAQVTLL